MNSENLLQLILKRFKEKRKAQVEGYNSFCYIRETNNSVVVTRETGEDTTIPFGKILKGINAYKANSTLYHIGPTALRDFGVTHLTSPVWSLLHLLNEENYK